MSCGENASRYLARVEAGETLDVANNGRLVAHLVPAAESEGSRSALIDAGVLVPARRPGMLTAVSPIRSRHNLTAILEDVRGSR
ncbi:type II toxin-antitoxin system Phd/YefM family antitoxin [Gordonia sp. DT30]|uniref:type II toxin-antitoxin system Phd/YefM family antitoxin n=1 Tax=unclassified Gordonia (in: high G+C Gram-positive bacteria) TaxID=2657482 RepID=UPI003CF06CC8